MYTAERLSGTLAAAAPPSLDQERADLVDLVTNYPCGKGKLRNAQYFIGESGVPHCRLAAETEAIGPYQRKALLRKNPSLAQDADSSGAPTTPNLC